MHPKPRVLVSLLVALAACGGGSTGTLTDVVRDAPALDSPAGDEAAGLDNPADRDAEPADGSTGDATLPGELPAGDALDMDVPATTDTPADGSADPAGTDIPAGTDVPADASLDPVASDSTVTDAADTDPGPVPVEYDPSARGPFDTRTTEATLSRAGHDIPAVAHWPNRTDGKTSPLVVFLPGFQTSSDLYKASVDHLASHGFVVVRATPAGSIFNTNHVQMTLDAAAVIDWALTSPGPLAGIVDPARIGIAGHSLGGKLATMEAYRDPRVKALFGIDPINGKGPIGGYTDALPDIVPDQVAPLTIPVGFAGEAWSGAHGTLGQYCAPADQNFLTFYDAATSAPWKAKWDFTGADHMDFVDDPATCGLTCSACPDGPGDDAAQVAAMRTLMTAFFRRHFGAETAMDAWLTGASVPSVCTATHSP